MEKTGELKVKKARNKRPLKNLGTLQLDYIHNLPTNCKNPQRKALTASGGYANAVKAKCQECVGFEDVVSRVSSCKIWKCPLNAFRPYQEK